MNDSHGAGGEPLVAVDGLTKTFGAVAAVEDLSFEARAGAVTGFLGQNGAGKSTTLRILLGLVHPTEGTATVLGGPYKELDRPAHRVGAVLETHAFHPLRSGRNHLLVVAAAAGIRDERVEEVLELVELGNVADRKTGKYSLGMLQRLGLAGALLGDPDVLILDEPANGLDPQGIRWLRELLKNFAVRNRAVLVSSHQLSEIEQIADEVVVIHHGRLVRQAPTRKLTGAIAGVTVQTSEPDRLSQILVGGGMQMTRMGPERLAVTNGTARAVGELAHSVGIPIFELASESTTLENAFLELTKEESIR